MRAIVFMLGFALFAGPAPGMAKVERPPQGAYADSAAAELFGGANHCRDSRGRIAACGAPTAPAGAIARCKDGAYSMSRDRQSACAANGGVAQWLR
jgi:hypothetical protein